MATRNLARTVIEVGRTSYSKHYRKRLRREERRKNRRFCYDAETFDDLDDLPSPPRIGGRRRDWGFSQDDKLNPAMRWLDSRIGQPWNDVFSELSQKFRGRGIALSHVVDFHMLTWIDLGRTNFYGEYEYVVDAEGLLQKGPGHGKSWRSPRTPRRQRPEAEAWAGNRKVIERGDRCYWTRPDAVKDQYSDEFRYVAHRQGDEFSAEDYEVWRGLTDWAKKAVSLAAYNLRD